MEGLFAKDEQGVFELFTADHLYFPTSNLNDLDYAPFQKDS